MEIILASKSPRRKEILQNLGVNFEIIIAPTNEESDISNGAELAEELSLRKAKAVFDLLKSNDELPQNSLIIGCDTIVCCDGEILGKPKDRTDAKRMITLLSGRAHEVISSLTLIHNGNILTSHETTKVIFDPLESWEADEYVATGECDDKAGAYGIQGLASRFIRGIEGCYFNVVGLPVNLLYRMTKQFGIELTKNN